VFKEFSYQSNIKKILNDIGLKKPSIVQSMVILKPPMHGGVVTPHQDETFIFTEKSGCVCTSLQFEFTSIVWIMVCFG
jgi:hypothetical protein